MSRIGARPYLVDDDLPGFDEIMHQTVPGPIAVVYDGAGTYIDSISLIQTTWRPGRQLTVRYRISGSGGGLDGEHDVVVMSGAVPDGATLIEGPDGSVGLWVVPDDPLLPGLGSALDLSTAAKLVADLGSVDEVTRSRLRAYRPGRRAVVEVTAGRSSIYLKVVPPAEVDLLHEKHRYLSDFTAVPDSLGVARELGLVVMPALGGVDLRSTLRSGRTPLPHPLTIAHMVEGLPAPAESWTSRSPIEGLPNIVGLLERLVPEEAGRLAWLAEHIGAENGEEEIPVHGDFHEAQILADGERPVGLIDVDTYGWGRPGDDAATMLGHLHLLAPSCHDPGRTIELAHALNRHWDSRFDPIDLRLRTAAVVLGLATGPFRVNRPNWPAETVARIDVAEHWVESAHRLDERSLIVTSGGSHNGIA